METNGYIKISNDELLALSARAASNVQAEIDRFNKGHIFCYIGKTVFFIAAFLPKLWKKVENEIDARLVFIARGTFGEALRKAGLKDSLDFCNDWIKLAKEKNEIYISTEDLASLKSWGDE